jgi:hypothetical protein
LDFPSATHASTSFSRSVSRAYASVKPDRRMTVAPPASETEFSPELVVLLHDAPPAV